MFATQAGPKYVRCVRPIRISNNGVYVLDEIMTTAQKTSVVSESHSVRVGQGSVGRGGDTSIVHSITHVQVNFLWDFVFDSELRVMEAVMISVAIGTNSGLQRILVAMEHPGMHYLSNCCERTTDGQCVRCAYACDPVKRVGLRMPSNRASLASSIQAARFLTGFSGSYYLVASLVPTSC